MVKNYGRVNGNISRIETKFTNNGTAVCNISIGATDSHYDKTTKEWINHDTVWWEVSLWGKDAEKATDMGITKGDKITVEGEITTHTYQKKDGTTGFQLIIKRAETWGWQPKNTKTIGAGTGTTEENDPWN
jgi:single stranded DNA-binding protein